MLNFGIRNAYSQLDFLKLPPSDHWVNAGRSMTVSYNSLGAGDYVFKVRSTDEHERMLGEFNFIRTHKSHLVNPKYIKQVTHNNQFLLLSGRFQD